MVRSEPSKLLIAGDIHGNERWIGSLCKLARRYGCDAILQLGDFGYWPHTVDGRRFLKHVDWHAERNGVACVYWIDGNHENHDALVALEPEPDGTVVIGERCRYIPRGLRWEWQGIRFGALGGALSVDRRERVEGESWWAGEVMTRSDLERLGDRPLDVLATHNAPEDSPLPGAEPSSGRPGARRRSPVADASGGRGIRSSAPSARSLASSLQPRALMAGPGRRRVRLAFDTVRRTRR